MRTTIRIVAATAAPLLIVGGCGDDTSVGNEPTADATHSEDELAGTLVVQLEVP